jgi:uncharacterized membrane protein YfcA
MVWSLRRVIDWRALLVFLAGGALGLPLGIHVLLHSEPAVYARIVGGALIAYVAFMLFRRPVVLRRQHALLDGLAGLVGGITGGAAAFPGALVTIWCGFKGWDKERQRGVFQPFILIMQIAALALLAAWSPHAAAQRAADLAGLAYLPAMLLGSAWGMAFFRGLNDRQFARAVNLLLLVSGVGFLI